MNTDLSKKIAKGALGEGLVIMLIMFIIAILFVVCVAVTDILKPDMDEILTQPGANQTYQTLYSKTPTSLDNIFMIVFVLLWAGAVILAFFVDAHPVWFVLTIIALFAVLIVVGVLSNTYSEFNNDMSSDMTSSLPMMDYVMEHFVHFMLAIIASVMISLFAKSQT